MKFAVTADVHLSRYGQDKIILESGLPERLDSIKKALYEIAEYCIENDIENIIIAGDLIHNKSIIYTVAQDLIIEYFERFSGITFWVIDGNHDITSKSSESVSALRSISNIKNVNWIPWNESLVQHDILFVPYSHQIVDIIKKSESKILISHFGLSEAQLSNGLSIMTNLKMSDLKKYQLVILGHYHKPQEIIKDDLQVYYTGSPIQLDWGEKGEEKRFLVFDNETLDIQSIPLTQYKKHIEIEINQDNNQEAIEEAKKALDEGHHVKLIKTDNVDISKIEKDYNIVDKTETDVTNRGISSTMTQPDRFKRYMEIKEIDENLNEEYLKQALEIVDLSEE